MISPAVFVNDESWTFRWVGLHFWIQQFQKALPGSAGLKNVRQPPVWVGLASEPIIRSAALQGTENAFKSNLATFLELLASRCGSTIPNGEYPKTINVLIDLRIVMEL